MAYTEFRHLGLLQRATLELAFTDMMEREITRFLLLAAVPSPKEHGPIRLLFVILVIV
jgi:hypothetical protein